jgi:type II secretory pathway component PulF
MLTPHAHTGISLPEGFLLHLSKQLPENPAVILVSGVIAFAAMFRLLEKLDAQAKWPELFTQAPASE